MNNTEQIAQLKILVSKKAGLDLRQPEAYKKLSEQIFIVTKNYLSETTIRNIFLENRASLTLFVLNALAQFVCFEDWPHFFEENNRL